MDSSTIETRRTVILEAAPRARGDLHPDIADDLGPTIVPIPLHIIFI